MIVPNIWEFSTKSVSSWAAAYAVWEPISYILFPMMFKASTVREYYNRSKFSFATVAAGDFLYSTVIFLVAQQVISNLFSAGAVANLMEWSKRLLTFIGIQWVADLSFYGLVKSLPDSLTPRYLDFFKRYGAEVGIGAPIGDTLYGIVWLSLTQIMASYVPNWVQLALIAAFLFFTLIVSY